MWKKILSMLKAATVKQKILVLIAALLVVSTVVAVPVLIPKMTKPVDGQHTEVVQGNPEEDTDKDTDKNQEGDGTTTTVVEVSQDNGSTNKKGGSLWDKIVDFFTGGNKSDKDEKENHYKVLFVTGDGTNLEQKSVAAGTKINSFPTPYRDGYVFLGWYYDKEGKSPVGSEDTVQKDLTLYAAYVQQTPLETVERKTFASAQNVGTDFCITVVTEDKSMSKATVLAGIQAENLTDPEQKDFIHVAGGKGTFTISGKNPVAGQKALPAKDGFAEGSTFRITLTDSRLCFQGEPEYVRDYNFTTDMEEVLNLAIQEAVKFISVDDLRNITNEGEHVETLSIALYTADRDGKIGPTELTQGTFEYQKRQLAVGDIVCVYAGLRPDKRTLDTPDEECGDVAYVEITKKNGNIYSYRNAEPDDVIFEPDMLPISVKADLDEDSKNHSVTVENKVFDYSADVYANVELDSQTTVDVGDFLMFYTGTFGVEKGADAAELTGLYGKITKVTDNGDGTTTVTYIDAEWEEVQAAMDVFTSQTMSGAEMLENVDPEALEAQIEQQALDSGFAKEAAQYLASLTLATNNFTKLKDNMNLKDYKVTLEDGTPISPEELQLMDSSIKVSCEMEDDYPKASLSIRPKHLGDIEGTNADKQGLSVELEVKAKITITKSGSKNSIVITVGGKFVEEVGVNLGARSKAVWKVWGIFPYIAEYRVTANVDLLNYTGVEVNATMVTKEADDDDKDDEDDDEGEDISEMIKGLLESKEEEGEDEEAEETSNKLIQRYSEMLEEEADYLKIVDVNLYETEKYLTNEIPIIALNMSVDFIIEMEACVSTGFDFEYMTGKRYTFTVDVFGRKVTCDSLVLQEEKYEFCFYVMGRLGIRAGIELEFNIGLFSTKLDSVGVEAAAGAYTRLWGYFYYELKYTASQGRSQSYSGAMLVEVGVFTEVGLNAQLLDGKFRTELSVFDKEWPLWSAGAADNVLDFSTKQEDMPKVKLKQYIRQTVIPDSVFELTYLDLKEGEEKQAVYEDYFDESKPESKNNRRNFVITMTNDKFSYDPQTNTISVHPAQGDKKLEGEMIITWVKYPLSFTSKPIQRTISLYWDNVRDGYVIVPYTNGGTYIPIIEAKYESKVNVPTAPEKLGYNFEGWYSDEECIKPYTFPEKMPAEDINIYAKWSERTDTPYRVEHYKENLLSGEYGLFETEEFAGTTDSTVTPEVKTYTGYQSPAKQEVKILPDGSAVLRYYYPLEWHTVTFDPGEVGGERIVYELKYGGRVIAPHMAAAGYSFLGWDQEVKDAMGTEDVIYTAQWKKNPDTAYRVEYYVQQIDGTYALQHLIEDTGFTGDTLAVSNLRNRIVDDEKHMTADAKYSLKNAIEFENMTVKGVSCEEAVIDASGKTVIKINYKRVLHKVTFRFGFDETLKAADVCYGGTISIPAVKRTGYKMRGWSLDGSTTVIPVRIMGDSDLTYTAIWDPNKYTVTFDKNHAAATGSMDDMLFTYDVAQKLTANKFQASGYVFKGWTTVKGAAVEFENGADVSNLVEDNGAKVTLYAVWEPEQYTITYLGCENAENVNPTKYTVESETIRLSAPVRRGYIFEGWYTTSEFSGNAVTVIQKGSSGNRQLYAKWKVDTSVEDENTCIVLFQTNGGEVVSGSTETRRFELGKKYGSLAVLKKTGYTFDGWYTKAEGGTKVTADSTVTTSGTNTLYAHFTPVDYTITYRGVDGANHSNPTSYTVEDGVTLTEAVKEGYTFQGWYAKEDYSGEVVEAIPENSVGNKTLYAKWTENRYQVIFHANNGNDITSKQFFAYTESKALNENSFTRAGYVFAGWATESTSTTVEYVDRQKVKGLSAEKGGAIHLYAVWELREYAILYENMYGVENAEDNPTSFTEQSNVITLHDPKERTGYTFGGWYLDAELTNPVVGVMNLTDYRDWTFYAKWTANQYTITFDSCLGDTVPTETLLMEYDKDANLTLLGEMGQFQNPGYTFRGWSTTKGGKVDYTDGQNVINLATQGNVDLYAVWELNNFTITYNVGTGTISHNNPGSYNYEDGDVKLTAPVAKEGYQFLGWYEGDTLVSEIVKGTQKDYTLTAKWAHGGIFYLTWAIANPDANHDRYIVRRVLPEGTVATVNPQHVYYRTLNKTAYGSTVDYTEENDKYHFKHVGGEDVYLTFGPNDFEQYFDVEVWGSDTKADIAATSGLTGKGTRGYSVNLYKVVDTVGGCQGVLGDEAKEQYCTLSKSAIFNKYTLKTDLYNWQASLIQQGQVKVTDDGYTENKRYTIDPTSMLSQNMSATEKQYMLKTASAYGFYIKYELREDDDGYQWASFNYGTEYKKDDKLAEYHFATKDGEVASQWGRTMTLPSKGAAQGDIIFNKGDCYIYNRWALIDDSVIYALIDTDKSLNFGFDASGKKDDDWYYRNLAVNLKVCDNRAPRQVGLAPMAFGQYKAGDEIFVTVIYDEVVAEASNLSLKQIEGMPLTNVAYDTGIGTNALVFKATVAQDFEVTPDFNNSIISIKPVTGTVKDILGNY